MQKTVKQLLSASVCDALVLDDIGQLQVSWLKGALMLVKAEDLPQEPLWVGEALRWLPESFLLPTILLPQSGLVRWKEIPESKDQAILELVMPLSKQHVPPVSVVATFDRTHGWMTRVDAVRPKITTTSLESSPWIGTMAQYQWVEDSMWVPTHMEAGWKHEDQVVFYFRGDNFGLLYTRQDVTERTQES